MMNHRSDDLDPEFEELFNALRPVPPRDPNLVAKGRARFIKEVDDLFAISVDSQPGSNRSGRSIFTALKETFVMKNQSGRTVLSAAAFVVIVLIMLFGSVGMTAYAAQSALPGDALYSVKTGLEETRLSLSSSAATQARLNLRYAERRMQEVADLIADGRFNNIADVSKEYEGHIQNALTNVQSLAQTDPALAAIIMSAITDALTRYSEVLTNISAQVPASAQPEMERLMQITQLRSQVQSQDQSQSQASETELIGVVDDLGVDYIIVDGQKITIIAATEMKDVISAGVTVKVHVITNPDGTLVAREIELAQMDDASNSNDNANDNDQSNENSNSNTNSNTNSNDNDDDNANGNDDNGNTNGENGNNNDNNGNGTDDNGNGNNNGNDDNGNSNDNGNDNSGNDDYGNGNG